MIQSRFQPFSRRSILTRVALFKKFPQLEHYPRQIRTYSTPSRSICAPPSCCDHLCSCSEVYCAKSGNLYIEMERIDGRQSLGSWGTGSGGIASLRLGAVCAGHYMTFGFLAGQVRRDETDVDKMHGSNIMARLWH